MAPRGLQIINKRSGILFRFESHHWASGEVKRDLRNALPQLRLCFHNERFKSEEGPIGLRRRHPQFLPSVRV
jgi:hypothetical protein